MFEYLRDMAFTLCAVMTTPRPSTHRSTDKTVGASIFSSGMSPHKGETIPLQPVPHFGGIAICQGRCKPVQQLLCHDTERVFQCSSPSFAAWKDQSASNTLLRILGEFTGTCERNKRTCPKAYHFGLAAKAIPKPPALPSAWGHRKAQSVSDAVRDAIDLFFRLGLTDSFFCNHRRFAPFRDEMSYSQPKVKVITSYSQKIAEASGWIRNDAELETPQKATSAWPFRTQADVCGIYEVSS